MKHSSLYMCLNLVCVCVSICSYFNHILFLILVQNVVTFGIYIYLIVVLCFVLFVGFPNSLHGIKNSTSKQNHPFHHGASFDATCHRHSKRRFPLRLTFVSLIKLIILYNSIKINLQFVYKFCFLLILTAIRG